MATEAICKIASAGAGGDYITLALAEDAWDGPLSDLQSADNRVFAGTLTGSLTSGDTLLLYRSGVAVDPSRIAVCVRAKSGELIVWSMNLAAEGETYGSGDEWRKDASNKFTISNGGDSIIPIFEGYNTAGSGADGSDTTATTVTGWTTSPTNYIEIRGAASDKTASNTGKWSTERYRLVVSNADAVVVFEDYVRFIDFQAQSHSPTAVARDVVELAPLTSGANDIRLVNCILVGSNDATYYQRGLVINAYDIVLVQNCIFYGYASVNSSSRIILMNGATLNIRNSTLIGGYYGLLRGGGTVTAKNVYAGGAGDSCFSGTIGKTNCASSDSTADGTNPQINIPHTTATFASVTDPWNYHLAGTGSGLYDLGIGPGSDADIPTTDIDGDSRSGATCDIGADEYVAAGGTEYPLSVSGAVTPTGSLTRQAGKLFAGGIAPSGTLARSIAKPLSAGITPVGILAKSTAKNMSGAITPTGALSIIKTILLALAGVITPAGSLIRQTAKGFSGSIASAGTVIRSTAKSMAGGITPTGALSVIKTFLLSISGAITPAGVLVKSTGKALTGSVASSGVLIKSVARSLAGGITPSGALSIGRIYQLALAGTMALSGVVTKAIGKALSGSLSLSGIISKSIGKAIAGAIALAGSVVIYLTGERRFDLTTTVSKTYVLTSSAEKSYVLRTSIAQPYTLTTSVSTRG